MPLTWVIGLLVASRIVKKPRLRKRLLWAGIVLLILISNQYISNRIMLWWEPSPIPMADVGKYDVGVIFTGVTLGDKNPRDRVYFRKGADRVTHTLQLYKAGKLDHILISGGLGFKDYPMTFAANRLKSFLVMAGVPDSVITVDIEASNTYENAVNSAAILNESFPDKDYLLITSAFHMKRSELCLRKQDIEFDKFPTDYYTGRSRMNFGELFIPKADAVMRWQKIAQEVVGIATYKLMGYL